MKILKIITALVLLLICQNAYSQFKTYKKSASGELQIEKRMAAGDDVVGVGEQFYYQIEFFNSNASNTDLKITDAVPAGLDVTSITAIPGTFVHLLGGPQNHDPLASPIIQTGNTIEFNGLGIYTKGQFRIGVKFPPETCDGISVTNNICAEYTNSTTGQIENVCTTTGLTSTSEAIDPWAELTIKPLYPAIVNNTSQWFVSAANPIAKLELTITKKALYQNQISGFLGLTNISVRDIFPAGATPSNITTTGGITVTGVDTSGTGFTFLASDVLNGNSNNATYKIIFDIDYSTSTPAPILSHNPTLWGEVCGDSAPLSKATDNLDITVTNSLPGVLGSNNLSKARYVANPVIGCLGQYGITFRNNDNRPISNINISDVLPDDIIPQGNISFSKTANPLSTSNTWDLSFNSSVLVSPYTMAGINATGNSIDLVATNGTELYPGEYVTISFAFTIASTTNTLAGGLVNNCATATGAILSVTPVENISEQACAAFTIEDPRPKVCVQKQVRKIQAGVNTSFTNATIDLKPGDEVEYRICVQNYGSAPFAGQIKDVLDSRFTYLGAATNAPSVTLNASNLEELEWNNVNVGASCSTVNFGGCNNVSPSQCYTFRAKVKPYTPAGLIPNRATVTGSGGINTSGTVNVRVVDAFVIDITKEISKNGLVWTNYLVETSSFSGAIQYRLKVQNIGNMPIVDHMVYDELPINTDVYWPTTNSRGTRMSGTFTSPTLGSSPNYTGTILPGRANATDCNPSSPLNPATEFTLQYESNTVLNPADVFTIQYGVTLPGNLNSGDIAVNSAYFVDCSGTTNIITPSQTATIEIYDPPCDTCPDNTEWNAYSQGNSIVNIPETGVTSELDGIPVYTEDVQIQSNWSWVTGVRIVMSEFTPIYEEGCESCHFNLDQVGNFVNSMFPAQLGNLQKQQINYGGSSDEFVREIVYSGIPDTSFLNGVNTTIALSLPDMINPNCCVVSYTACIKYIFEGPNCENCEAEYCFTAPDGPIHEDICQEPEFEIGAIPRSKSECCSQDLKPLVYGCARGAEFNWRDSQGVIVHQGTINGTASDVLTVTQNGTYTLEVGCKCPDEIVKWASSTQSYTVNDLLDPLPAGTGMLNHSLQRYSNLTAKLTANLDPLFMSYEYSIHVDQRSKGGNFGNQNQTPIWSRISSFSTKAICEERNLPVDLRFNYNRLNTQRVSSGSGPYNYGLVGDTWEDVYRIVINWKDCSGMSQQRIVPVTNLPPVLVIFTGGLGGSTQRIPSGTIRRM